MFNNPYNPHPQYNPNLNPNAGIIQDRLNILQNPMYQQQPQPQQANNMLPCRPVTNIEEAKASMIDAFNTHVFADFANGKIYTKQITNNGTASFNIYALELPKEEIKPVEVDRVSVLEKEIEELKTLFNQDARFSNIEKEIEKLKTGVKSNEYSTNNASSKNFTKSDGVSATNSK